jgi:TP53 regulating kinase and related kinases
MPYALTKHSSIYNLRADVKVPTICMVDAAEGVLGIEWINGKSVRVLLGGGADDEDVAEEIMDEDHEDHEGEEEEQDMLSEYLVTKSTSFAFDIDPLNRWIETFVGEVMSMIGTEIAKMHLADVIHGDLTTSNMMLRHPTSCPSKKAELVRSWSRADASNTLS